MTDNDFRYDTGFPPQPPPVHDWPPTPPAPSPGRPHGARHPRRWLPVTVAALIGFVVASTAVATLTLQSRASNDEASASTAPPTVTVTKPAPPSSGTPPPFPAAQADRLTCATRSEASRLISESAAAQGVIPEGMDILDPAVQSNPAWKAGAQDAGRLFEEAGAALRVTPGTTPLLANAATTASKALLTLGTAYTTFSEVNGNTFTVAQMASDIMDMFCERL